MDKRFGNRKTGKLLAAAVGAAGLAGFGASKADAALLIDVRATGATTAGTGVVDPKTVVLSGVGDTVTLGVFAAVSGTNGVNDEGFTSVFGLLNSVGGLKGNLSGGYVPAFFTAGVSQNGSVVDWDSDGDLDIGLSPTSSSGTGKFAARSTATTPMPSIGGSVLIGEFVFTATSATDITDVNFRFRTLNGANVAAAGLWFEDGSTVSKNPTLSPSAVGVPVNISIPEPASLGLMALASVGLLGRRRK